MARAGRHQLENAAVAIATLHELRRSGWDVDERSIRAGLAHVRWPARAEIFPCRPIFVLDTAHNVASMTALNDVLQQIPVTGRRWLLFAASRDKDANIRIVGPRANSVTTASGAQLGQHIDGA